jgi:hypothetical protein
MVPPSRAPLSDRRTVALPAQCSAIDVPRQDERRLVNRPRRTSSSHQVIVDSCWLMGVGIGTSTRSLIRSHPSTLPCRSSYRYTENPPGSRLRQRQRQRQLGQWFPFSELSLMLVPLVRVHEVKAVVCHTSVDQDRAHSSSHVELRRQDALTQRREHD